MTTQKDTTPISLENCLDELNTCQQNNIKDTLPVSCPGNDLAIGKELNTDFVQTCFDVVKT